MKSSTSTIRRRDRMSEKPLKVIAGAPDRPLRIGTIEIECYVLEDETRVLSRGGFQVALGRHRTSRRHQPPDVVNLGPLERSGLPPPSGGFTPSRCGLFLLRRSHRWIQDPFVQGQHPRVLLIDADEVARSATSDDLHHALPVALGVRTCACTSSPRASNRP